MELFPRLRSVLNTDIMINIMTMSDTRTVVRLMLLCRDLYHEGPKHLRRHTLRLSRETCVPSFVAFMKAEHHQRLRYLKRLRISIADLSKAVSDVLEHFIVECAPALQIEELTIDHAEDFFKSSLGLPGCFALLHSIKRLSLVEVGKHADTFLTSSRSHLLSAELEMIPHSSPDEDSSDEEEDADDDFSFRNPILQLRNSQDTLESLTVCSSDTFSDFGVFYEQCYPNVKELILSRNEAPKTTHYTRAFPNLQKLDIAVDSRDHFELVEYSDLDPIETCRHFRMLNKFEQQQHGPWTTLKTVRAPVIDHYLLGLIRPVEQLHIAGPIMGKKMFHSVLGVTRPVYLSLDGFDSAIFLDGEFKSLVRGPFLETVRALEITLFLGKLLAPELVDVPQALNALVDGLAQMASLRSFGLTIHCYGL
ncbi:hypothetical protein C2E23DRAFT_822444 [Lenzites betulinus]|nr:hypothetical protein C2E23DRAFT_822444 [Lenzites betulinus]